MLFTWNGYFCPYCECVKMILYTSDLGCERAVVFFFLVLFLFSIRHSLFLLPNCSFYWCFLEFGTIPICYLDYIFRFGVAIELSKCCFQQPSATT
ncbi:hypothetical protein LQ764DRAFT_236000 [Zygosaccharomyces rouxii]|nr:hypothetical protein LQ764DRAFT_236000 [Zygosaccharomyces rouxii]